MAKKALNEEQAQHRLVELAEEFEQWRQHRAASSERIPEPLWSQAVALSRALPNSRVAKVLRLSPSALKARRLGPAAKTASRPARPRNAGIEFVELPVERTAVPSEPISAGVQLELERLDGTRLRLRCSDPSTLETLMQRFLG